MSVKIKLKHSAVNGKAPLPSDLDSGELALNTNAASPAAYIKDSAGNIVKLAGTGAIGGTDATTTAKGIVQLADATALTAGTAGRIVDAAQLKAVSDADDWTRTGTTLAPKTAGDVVNISAGTAALPGLTPVGDANSGLFSPGADQIAVSTGGVGRLFVNASGNIGVGAAPTTRLEVSRQGGAWPGVAPISGTALFVHSGSASTTSTARLSILGGSASEASIHFGDTDNSSEAIIKLDNTSDSLRFEVNGSERLRIDGNGRLLAGTSSAFPVR